ncbi:ribonuclease toxin immunity protein CdiI [Providencia sp. PROV175]|uniref:ribonuclease toxin immunity protein CdiI n=1 Tax=Providencia sp. PROV175 TaxID=2949878 RepID=UPI00234B2912|nr:ribonuclease toxin immunity protein CdiI [Providencia sp. PROV175]WOB91777.1 ribonuclease toxin immunity protein CdiI [Providencia sp. PROV175]
MNEYLFEIIDYDNDPNWVIKDFFNSLNLSERLIDSVEKIISRCGFVINETYCHFPDLDDPDPEFHFDGIMFGVWQGKIIVPDTVGYKYTKLACEKYLYLHPDKNEEINSLINRLPL